MIAAAGIWAVALFANTLMATRAAAQACGAYDLVTGFVECKSDAATVTAIESAGGVAYAGGGTLGLLTVKLKDGLLFAVPGVGVASAGVASSVVLLSGGLKIVAGAIGVETSRPSESHRRQCPRGPFSSQPGPVS